MSAKVVDVTLRLIDKVSSPLNAIGGKLAKSSQQWQKAGKQIQSAGSNIASVGSKMTKSLTVPIAGMGVACVKVASDFEKGMSKVQSISGATGKDIDELSKKAKEMGAKTKYSATEATDAFSYMAMAGWKTKDMLDGIEPIMKLAGASGEDLASTSDIVTDALTGFGKTADDAKHFTDVLAVASSNSNTNVGLMGETFKYVAPLAGALKYSVDDVAVAVGLMANSGIKASQAGTSLRSWLTRLAKPTDEVETAMKKLGLSLTDSTGKTKPFNQVMTETRTAFSKLSDTQKAQYASTIAGKNGMSGLLAVVNGSDKDFDKLTQSVQNSSGACEKMYNVANNNLTGQLTILKSTVESIAISFGEKMTPYVKKATEWLQKLADKFNSLTDEQQNTIIKVALVVASIGPAILIFGKMVGTVGKVVSVVGKVGKAFKTFGSLAGIIASPAGIVIAVLAGIAVGAVLIYKNWDKLKPIFSEVGNQIKKTVGDIMPYIKKAIPVAIGIMKKALNVVLKVIKAMLPYIKKAVPVVMNIAKKAIEMIGKALKVIIPVIGKILKTVQKCLPTIKKIFITALNAIMPIVQQAIKIIGKIAKVVGAVLVKAFNAVMPVIKKLGDMFQAVFPVVVAIVQKAVGIVSGIIKALQPVFTTVFGVIGNVVSNIGDTISNIFGGIMKTFSGIIDFITGVFTGNWKKAWEGIKGIFKGIADTFVGIIKAPINGIISIINGAIKGLNKIKIPDWVPVVGGKGINIPEIPKLAKGSQNWKGGIAQVSERGGEIIDLPQGTRVYPHDETVKKAYTDGAKASARGNTNITIAKLADQIIVREDADIDKIAQKLANKLEKVSQNTGGGELAYLY